MNPRLSWWNGHNTSTEGVLLGGPFVGDPFGLRKGRDETCLTTIETFVSLPLDVHRKWPRSPFPVERGIEGQGLRRTSYTISLFPMSLFVLYRWNLEGRDLRRKKGSTGERPPFHPLGKMTRCGTRGPWVITGGGRKGGTSQKVTSHFVLSYLVSPKGSLAPSSSK